MRIRLIHMEDPYPLPPGSTGTVFGTDCNGDLEVVWDNKRTLKLIPGVDKWSEIHEEVSACHSDVSSDHSAC